MKKYEFYNLTGTIILLTLVLASDKVNGKYCFLIDVATIFVGILLVIMSIINITKKNEKNN